MMMHRKITFFCKSCEHAQTIKYLENTSTLNFNCGFCQTPHIFVDLHQKHFDRCPVCASSHLYQHKDFNKILGFIIFAIGAVLIPYTYSLSLIAVLIIDALLYPFCKYMCVCYACMAEMRGVQKNPRLGRFSHELAAHYEK